MEEKFSERDIDLDSESRGPSQFHRIAAKPDIRPYTKPSNEKPNGREYAGPWRCGACLARVPTATPMPPLHLSPWPAFAISDALFNGICEVRDEVVFIEHTRLFPALDRM